MDMSIKIESIPVSDRDMDFTKVAEDLRERMIAALGIKPAMLGAYGPPPLRAMICAHRDMMLSQAYRRAGFL